MAKLLNLKKRIREKKKEAEESKGFIVRDCRDSFFVVDDEYLNGFASIISHQASLIYFCLCRHVGKEQVCYPSYEYLSKKIRFYRGGVIRCIKELEAHKIIKVDREKGQPNIYTLLNKKQWRKFVTARKVKEKDEEIFNVPKAPCGECKNNQGSAECGYCVGGSRASYFERG